MTIYQWVVAAMLLIPFIDRTANVFLAVPGRTGAHMIAAFTILIGWQIALVMLLHGGGFW